MVEDLVVNLLTVAEETTTSIIITVPLLYRSHSKVSKGSDEEAQQTSLIAHSEEW